MIARETIRASGSSERAIQIQVHEMSRHKPTKRRKSSTQSPSLAFVMYNPLLLVQHRLLDCWLRLAGSADLDFSIRRRRLVGVDAGRGWLWGACIATRRRFGSSGIRGRNRLLGWSSSRSRRSRDRLLSGRHSRSPSIVLWCRSRKSFLIRPGSA